MSFLKPMFSHMIEARGGDVAGKMAAVGGEAPNMIAPNAVAKGFGHLVGRDPSQISSIANRIGMGANQIAAAGGAAPGYAAPEPQINNHLQMLDRDTLQALIRKFQGVQL